MPDVTLAIQDISRTGVVSTYQAFTGPNALLVADSFFLSNNGQTFVHIKNGATAASVIIAIPGTVDGLPLPDRDVAIPASTEMFIGPFQPTIYNNGDRNVQLDFTTPDTVEIAVSLLA